MHISVHNEYYMNVNDMTEGNNVFFPQSHKSGYCISQPLLIIKIPKAQ